MIIIGEKMKEKKKGERMKIFEEGAKWWKERIKEKTELLMAMKN